MRRLAALASATLVVAAGAAGSAHAGEATLWACHGPGGQPLGVPPLTAASTGDGFTTTYGSGCASPITSLADGGITAALTRADPTGASGASWQAEIPAGLPVTKVQLNRRTRGFGGTPVPGGAQSYAASTSAGTLESASVADASNVPLDGLFSTATAGQTYVRFGVSCAIGLTDRCAAPSTTPLAVDVSALAATVNDAAAPKGAVGGLSSPAAGTLGLTLRATDEGLGLGTARVTVDGTLVAAANLGDAACTDLSPSDPAIDLPLGAVCPTSVTDAPIGFDTTGFGDGPHHLVVVVRDASGNDATVADDTFTIRNTPPGTQSTATLTVGNSGVTTGSGNGSGSGSGSGDTGTSGQGGLGTTGPPCLSPQLSMLLREKPLRVVKGVPVLLKNHRYRFAGTLTCVANGKRVKAPAGVVIELRNTVGKKSLIKSGATTRPSGLVTFIVSYRSSRLLEFRYRDSGGKVARVRIRITVSAKKTVAKKAAKKAT
jgi:hypothetical protein